MNDVAFWQSHFPGKVDMATATVSRRPLVFVGVTAEARWVLRSDVVGVDGDVDMAADAVAGAFLVVKVVL